MEPTPVVQQTRKASQSGAKVTVACKLPNGLLIHADKMVASRELVMGGGTRDIEIAERGEPIKINGTATPFGVSPRHGIVAGYAITRGVDKDIWDKWLESNKDSAMVRNGLICAFESVDRAQDFAKEHRKARSGLEPFAKDGDPRAPRVASSNLVETGEDEDRASKVA